MLSSTPLTFTPRQVQIIRLIDQGMTYDEMGEQLGIAPRTVKAHADTIRIKLNEPDYILFGSFLTWAVIDRISIGKRNAFGPLGARTGGLSGDILAVGGGLAIYLFMLFWGHRWLIGVPLLP